MATGGAESPTGPVTDDIGSKPLVQEFLRCNICLEKYNKPRVLPCLHTFCEMCLENHVRINVKVLTRALNVFSCPTCREETTLPEEGPRGFRRDFRMEQLQDLLQTTDIAGAAEGRTSTLTTSEKCEFCVIKDITVAASRYCQECQKLLCNDCTRRHRNKRIFADHAICDMDSRRRLLSVNVCRVHPTEPLDYLCQDCNVAICNVCAMGEHDHHLTLDVKQGLGEALENLKFQLKLMNGRLNQLGSKLGDIDKAERSIRDQLITQCGAVKGHVDEVVAGVEAEGRQLLDEVNDRCQDMLDRNDRQHSDIELVVARLNSLCDLSFDLIGRPASITLVKSYSDLTVRIEQALEDSLLLNPPVLEFSEFHLEFVPKTFPSPNKLGFIRESNHLESTGHRRYHQSVIPGEITPIVPFCGAGGPAPTALTPLARFGRLGEAGGEFDSPRDVCFLSNGSFAVADTNNDRLQIFDTNGLLVRVVAQGQTKPWGVTCTKQGHIAVTDNYDKCIKIFTIEGELVEKIGKLLCPCGITTTAKGEFVVTDFFSTNAFFLDGVGTPIRKFEMRNRARDQHTCGASRIVAGVSGQIVISDISNCCVKVFDRIGRFQYRITDQDHLISPQGISADQYGNILVADAIKQCIHVLDETGAILKSLSPADGKLRDATGLAVSKRGHVVITHMKANHVKLFQLEY